MGKIQHVPLEDYLIHGDSTEAFMRYCCTNTFLWKLYLRHFSDFIKYKLHVLRSSSFYQILLKDLLEGMPQAKFESMADEFAYTRLDNFLMMPHLNHVLALKSKGINVQIESTGLMAWIRPWCEKYNITNIVAPMAEVGKAQQLTGRILKREEK